MIHLQFISTITHKVHLNNFNVDCSIIIFQSVRDFELKMFYKKVTYEKMKIIMAHLYGIMHRKCLIFIFQYK